MIIIVIEETGITASLRAADVKNMDRADSTLVNLKMELKMEEGIILIQKLKKNMRAILRLGLWTVKVDITSMTV